MPLQVRAWPARLCWQCGVSKSVCRCHIQLLELNDPAQVTRLHRLFARDPTAIALYLRKCVFPLCLRHRTLKLSAGGEELGGSIVFGTRLGFSGTPSSLLPVDMGACRYGDLRSTREDSARQRS